MTIENILIIDDDYDFQTLIRLVLDHDTDWQILQAADGEEGLTKAQLYNPSIILLDIVMPNLNGLEVYYLLKSNPMTHFIPIIFTTARPDIEAIIRTEIAENVKVITKPFDLMTLSARIINVEKQYSFNNMYAFSYTKLTHPYALDDN